MGKQKFKGEIIKCIYYDNVGEMLTGKKTLKRKCCEVLWKTMHAGKTNLS